MRASGAEIIVKLLERQGVATVAGIPGGCNLPIYNVLGESRIRHILVRHEQGAGFIAQGIARITGGAGVCLATSGPGAANLVTAVADAKLDSIPLVAITGQVSTDMLGTDAFQEVDTYGMTLPITKHNFLVRSAEELLTVVPEAFRIAESGRPGPVVIDVPKNAQTEIAAFDAWPAPGRPDAPPPCRDAVMARAAERLAEAKRPVLYVGGGVSGAKAARALRVLAEKQDIPVAATLMGLDRMPRSHPLFLGLLGMHGARHTNYVLEEADLLLAVGVRFDDRATGLAREFCRRADIIHVDIDNSEIDKIKGANIAAVCDAGEALEKLAECVPAARRPAWSARTAAIRAEHPEERPDASTPMHPMNLIRRIASLLPDDAVIVTDVGQHQMWTAQAYPFTRPGSFLTSGGLGTMGFGMPTAIGAALADPDRMVVCISGDGSIQMNIQELATLAETRANVKMLVFNNGRLGLVRQQQELFYDKRYVASSFASSPDFAAVARGYGLPGFDLGATVNADKTLATILTTPGPGLVNIPIDHEENVYPMVPPGAPNREMIAARQTPILEHA